MKIEFPLLEAEDIECRVAMVKDNGLQLLLYKDARVDQNILDATVGPMNWMREHSTINGSLYCTVSIWDEERGQWVGKSDVGEKSNISEVKGEASDSFKRACTNWGIGRELYTSPFIWVPANACAIKPGRGKPTCSDRFEVRKIIYDDRRRITDLEIYNATKKCLAYPVKDTAKQDGAKAQKPKAIGLYEYNEIQAEMARTGITEKTLLATYKIKTLQDMTADQYQDAMYHFKCTPSSVNPADVDAMAAGDNLPFN